MSDGLEGKNPLNIVMDNWQDDLSNAELRVFLFIYRRTYAFGKMAETIPLRHFVDGVHMREGATLHRSSGLSKSQVKEGIAALEQRGFIFVQRRQPRANLYVLSPEIPERPETGSSLVLKPAHRVVPNPARHRPAGRLVIGRLAGSSSNLRRENLGDLIAMPLRDMPEKVQQILAKSRAARDKRKGKQSVVAYETVWQDALREFRPNSPRAAWIAKDRGQIKQLASRVPDINMREFLETIIRHWDLLMSGRFRRLQTKPREPHIGFVVRFFNDLYDEHRRLISGSVSAPAAAPVLEPDKPLTESERQEYRRMKQFLMSAEAVNTKAVMQKPVARLKLRRPVSGSGTEALRRKLGFREWKE